MRQRQKENENYRVSELQMDKLSCIQFTRFLKSVYCLFSTDVNCEVAPGILWLKRRGEILSGTDLQKIYRWSRLFFLY